MKVKGQTTVLERSLHSQSILRRGKHRLNGRLHLLFRQGFACAITQDLALGSGQRLGLPAITHSTTLTLDPRPLARLALPLPLALGTVCFSFLRLDLHSFFSFFFVYLQGHLAKGLERHLQANHSFLLTAASTASLTLLLRDWIHQT